MPLRKTLGFRIAQARRELAAREGRDVTKAMLASAAGVDPSAITLYEGDKSNVSEPVLARLAKFLGVTPAYLRYGVGEKIPASEGGLDDIEAGAVMLTPAQLARAEEQAAATLAAKRQAATNEPRARQPRKRAR